MPLPVIQFPVETYEQANPFMASFSRGMNLGNNLIQNALLAQQRREAIKQQKIRNQLLPDILKSNMLKQNLQSQNLQYQLAHPELNVKSDPISQAIWLDKVKNEYGEQSPIYQNALRSLSAKQTYYEGRGQLAQIRSKGYPWYSLPADVKKYNLALARGMGYNDSEAQKLLASGVTIGELAKRKGKDLQNIIPQYPPTTATQTRSQQRVTAQSELGVISNKINDWLAPYSQGAIGKAKLMKDLALGKNTDQISNFLAASSVLPEIAGIRAKGATGGVPGSELIKEFTQAAYQNLRAPAFSNILRSPQIFKDSQRKIDSIVKEMVEAATKAALKPRYNQSSKQNDEILDKKVLNGKTYIKKSDGWYEVS